MLQAIIVTITTNYYIGVVQKLHIVLSNSVSLYNKTTGISDIAANTNVWSDFSSSKI